MKPKITSILFLWLILGIAIMNTGYNSSISIGAGTGKNSEDYNGSEGTFSDSRDGQTYKWVKIGNQVWMAENLSYDAGDGCWFYDDDKSDYKKYGRLYDWETAQKACPPGWHVPSDAEWTELIDYLGGTIVAGGKMKEAGTTHWDSPNTGATNESGFSALPGGSRSPDGWYAARGSHAAFWSATEYVGSIVWYRVLGYDYAAVFRFGSGKSLGFSVRCVRD